VAGPDGREDRTVRLPGGRAHIRDRTTTIAMHMLRRVLSAA
jgi:nicotinamide-nucleotide amidase